MQQFSDGPEAGMGRGVSGFSRAVLRQGRKSAGLTVAEFAAEAEVSDTTVQRWESGRAIPTAYHLGVMAQVLGRNPEDFVAGASNQLRAWRVLAGMSIDEAARRSGLSKSTIHRLEQASIGDPTPSTVDALAATYGCTIDEIREAIDAIRAARQVGAKARGAARRAQQ